MAEAMLGSSEAGYIIGHGIALGLFQIEPAVQWCDLQIAKTSQPPLWLLDFSTMQQKSPIEASRVALAQVPVMEFLRAIGIFFGLIPDLHSYPADQLGALAWNISRLAQHLPSQECDRDLIQKAVALDASFDLQGQGYIDRTVDSLRLELIAFIDRYSLPPVASQLAPIQWQI